MPLVVDSMDLGQVASSDAILSTLPPKAQQTHMVYTKIQKLSIDEYVPYAFFNQTSWKPQVDKPLIDYPKGQWDKNQLSISTGPEPTWVDLVVNNLDEGPHPFHLVCAPNINLRILTDIRTARSSLLRPGHPPSVDRLGFLQPI